MTPFSIGCIGMAALVVAIFLRVPIGMGMIGIGALGFAAISGLNPALGLLRSVPYETYELQLLRGAAFSDHGQLCLQVRHQQ